jgi:uncharacterized protein YdhG (YjbR/CyaY superfamily)
MKEKTPATVTAYIKSAPTWAKQTLKDRRKAIVAAAPKATESISYHMPYYAEEGLLAYFGFHKNHCSFHWISAEDKIVFARELAKVKVKGSTLQIPQGAPVPVTLIKKLVKSRVKANRLKSSK